MSELIMAVALLCSNELLQNSVKIEEARNCQSRLLTCAYKGKKTLAENLADCVKEKK